ncbi:MAG: MBL fold metallo-hydrolase [Candidatus Omnitrophota bacterium]
MQKSEIEINKTNFIKFLGTAGARFVMIKQLRSSAGIWISSSNTNILVDPGPGSIVRCALSRPKLDVSKLDGIILTHRHLDHSNDINVMIEAMTEGGFKKRGIVFCPQDALTDDPVILKYARKLPEKIEILKSKKKCCAGNFKFQTSIKHVHPVETYGIKFKIKNTTVSLIMDTQYFKSLSSFYKSDILIVSVVLIEPRKDIYHLSLRDVENLIKEIRPKKVVLTHFGMTMLRAKPHLQAEELSRKLKVEVIAAYDGMVLNF